MKSKILHLLHRIAYGIAHCEQPFHLAYLGPAAHYYANHEAFLLASGAGGLFLVILIGYIVELMGGD